MPFARPALLALVLVACAHARAEAPAEPDVPADPPATATAEPAEPVADRPAEPAPRTAQVVTFDDDADPEPSTQVRSAPKRPPMPRFRLFGTREGDGPN
jgi:hypothetical protein